MAGWRKGALAETARQPVGDKEFGKWRKFRLLPAFDLLLWSRVTDAKYTDTYIARAIWQDADDDNFVDLTERFRKVTRPMLEQYFAWDFVERFWRQMELENTLDVVVARDKAKKAAASKASAPATSALPSRS